MGVRRIIPVLGVIVLLMAPGLGGAQATDGLQDDQQLGQRFSGLLRTIDDLLVTSQPGEEDEVRKMYQQVRPALRSRDILILFSRDQLEGIDKLSSVYFSYHENQAYLVINPTLFDLSDRYPSLALSLVVEALVHVRNYLELGEQFQTSYSQPVERYLYSMDALYLQTLFISRYLAGGYSLSGYEEYLVQALEVDKLASASLFLRGVDQDIVYSLIEHNSLVRDNEITLAEYLTKIGDLLTRLQKNFQDSQAAYQELKADAESHVPDAGDDLAFAARQRYITTVSTGTFLKYGVGVINQLLVSLQDRITAQETLGQAVDAINHQASVLYQEFSREQRDVSPYRRYFINDLIDLD